MKIKVTLSKSKIVEGLTCDKKVYLSIHHLDLRGPVTADKQYFLDQGFEIGFLAQKQYPDGFSVEADYLDVQKGVELTQKAISEGNNTIYEATFLADSLLCKVDILHRENSNEPWHLIEVKSGSSAKPEYMIDASIQAHILNLAGIEWNKVSIMHLNKECRHPDLS